MKKVSIIIPCYNQESFITEAIESALNQTYKNLEIVVINDASTDNSAQIIQSFADKNSNIVFLNETVNKGVVKSKNLAISKCSGDYILPVDGDDKIENTYVEKAVAILDKDEDVRIAYARTQLFGSINEEFKLADFSPAKIIFNNCIPNTAMFRKEDFIAVGGYHEYMKDGWEDWNLWISILEIAQNREKCAQRIDEKLYLYRMLNTQTRSSFGYEVKNKLFVNIISNHQKLYSEVSDFYKHIHKSLPSKLEKKNRIIKNLIIFSSILLLIIIVQFLFLIF